MSVYFINANDEGDTGDETADEPKPNPGMTVSTISQTQTEAHAALAVFWPKINEEINSIRNMDLKVQALPLARIKKIMKLDEDVKMISAEAPVLFAKAVEIFIHELTLRAWVHTEDNKRRTLQRNDIAMAVAKYDQFDFLIDIVPRDEVKAATSSSTNPAATVKTENNPTKTPEQVQYYLQIAQQHNQILQGSSSDAANNQTVTTAGGQLLQIPASAAAQGGNIQIVHQVLTPSGELQNIPLQLNQNQLQVIRMQMQNGTNQPVIVQSVAGQQNTNSILPMI